METQPETDQFVVEQAPLVERTTIAGMMQRYLPEVAPFSDLEAAGDGRWRYPTLDLFWHEDGRHAFIFKLGKRNAGFALVREVAGGTMMVEFYIAPDFRHQGLGTDAATQIFRQFPGKWAVRQPIGHASAQEFFRRTVARIDRSFSERIETSRNGRSYTTQGFEVR